MDTAPALTSPSPPLRPWHPASISPLHHTQLPALLLLLLLLLLTAALPPASATSPNSLTPSAHPPLPASTHDSHFSHPSEFSLQKEWQRYHHHLCSIQIRQDPLCGLLKPLLQYNFSISPQQLRRSLAHLGPNQRMRRVVMELMTGRQVVNIGVIGTSVSFGTGASKRGVTDWFSMVEGALRASFPNAKLKLHNGCFPGTPSSFANMCLSKMVRPDVDLLLVEYVTNDFALDSMFDNPKMRAYERLLRKILQYKSLPAVVLVQFITWGQSFKLGDTERSAYKKWFHESAEDQYGTMAQYYSLPWLSYRNAVWIDAEYATGRMQRGWEAVTDDYTHPNDSGHRVVLDLVMWLVQQTAIDLLLQPFSRWDSWYIRQQLPAPMHYGNYEERGDMCLMDSELQSIVRHDLSSGWSFVNEGTADKPKTGFVATTAGSKLVLEFELSAVLGEGLVFEGAGQSPEEERSLHIMISYLISYTAMGQASISCLRGCTCQEAVLDGHHEQQTSTTFMKLMLVTGTAPACRVQALVLDTSSSGGGGHKFKISAVMMNRKSALGFAWPDEPAMFVAEDVFSGEFGSVEVEVNQAVAKKAGQQAPV